MKVLGPGEIEFIPFPAELEGRYQHFTEADTTALRSLEWSEPFTPLEPGVRETLQGWSLEAPAVEGV
jgi:ADP-L-glycero-D-manno-heptose 6-epimerase